MHKIGEVGKYKYLLMAYTLGNKCAKNCCKQTIPVQLIVEDVVTCFLEHSVEGKGKKVQGAWCMVHDRG